MAFPLPKTNNSRTWDALDRIFDEAFAQSKNKMDNIKPTAQSTPYRTPDGYRSPGDSLFSPDTTFQSPETTTTYLPRRNEPRFSHAGATPYSSWYYGNGSNESLGLSVDDLEHDLYGYHSEEDIEFNNNTLNNTQRNSTTNLNSIHRTGEHFGETWNEGLRQARRSTIANTTTQNWRGGLDNTDSSGSGTASTSSGSMMGLGFGLGVSPPGRTASRNTLGTSPPARSGMGASPPVRSGTASPPVRSSMAASPPARPSMAASPPARQSMAASPPPARSNMATSPPRPNTTSPAPAPQAPTDGPAVEVKSPGPGERERVTSPEPGPGGKVKRKKSKATFQNLPDGRTVKATFDLQGVKKSDVHVSYQNDKVVVSWERVETEERHEDGKVVRERREKRWVRTLPLPDGTKFEEVKASMDGRHLVLTYPKYNVRNVKPVLTIQTKID